MNRLEEPRFQREMKEVQLGESVPMPTSSLT